MAACRAPQLVDAPPPPAPPAAAPPPLRPSAQPAASAAPVDRGQSPAAAGPLVARGVALPAAPTAAVAVLRVHEGRTLVPLACALGGALVARDACLPGLPVDAEVQLLGGGAARLGARQTSECAPSGESVVGLAIRGAAGPTGEWAVTGQVQVKTWDLSIPPEVAADVRARLQAALRSAAPSVRGPLRIDQALEVDLDADGVPERLYVVHVAASDEDPAPRFSGILQDDGVRARVLTRDDQHLFTVLGALDLDGDGRAELVLRAAYSEGDETAVVHLEDGSLVVIGAWGCGA